MAEGYSIQAQYVTAIMDIASGTAVYVVMPRDFVLNEIRVCVSIITATAAETITVARNVIPNTTTTEVAIGTFSIPSGTAAGSQIRISTAGVADTTICSGESISLTGGNSTGTGSVYFALLGYHFEGVNLTPQHGTFTTTSTKAVGSSVGSISYGAFTAT